MSIYTAHITDCSLSCLVLQVDTDVYGIDYNPETVLLHQESVEVPATMEIGDDHRQRIQDILQKDSNNLGVDIYKELLEFWTVNLI